MGTDRASRIAWLAGLALLIVAPFIGLYPIFMMKALCFAIFACAFNLLLGYTGLLSFGHAAYLGAAAYGTGWLIKSAGWSPELGVLAGTLFAAAIGLLVGLIAIRRQGIYFAMITLALAQMAYFFSLQTPRFTGGEDGIQAVPRGKFLGLISLADDRVLYWLVAAIVMGGLLLIYR
ncbi:MAG: branched-chain amino acid ABC transporter permease, partial [Burkholderiaceae bacterium]